MEEALNCAQVNILIQYNGFDHYSGHIEGHWCCSHASSFCKGFCKGGDLTNCESQINVSVYESQTFVHE